MANSGSSKVSCHSGLVFIKLWLGDKLGFYSFPVDPFVIRIFNLTNKNHGAKFPSQRRNLGSDSNIHRAAAIMSPVQYRLMSGKANEKSNPCREDFKNKGYLDMKLTLHIFIILLLFIVHYF